MTTVGIVSPGHMGAGLGWALREGGAEVVSTVEGRSARTRRLAGELTLLPTLREVVSRSDVVLLVTPPAAASEAAAAVAAAAMETGAGPLVVDLNAVAPSTVRALARVLAPLDLVDGSISGPPPTVKPGARIYLSGTRAAEVASLPWRHVEPIVVGDEIGTASAVKMCTASVYKGLVGLYAQAMRVAASHDVLAPVLADLRASGLDYAAGVPLAATKAHRFVGEMLEIAATQAGAGATPKLFEAFATVYAELAQTALAQADPESLDRDMPDERIAAGMAGRTGVDGAATGG